MLLLKEAQHNARIQCKTYFSANFVGEADSLLKNPIAPSRQHRSNTHITKEYPAGWDNSILYPFWFFSGDESLVLALKFIFNLNFLPYLEFEGNNLSGNYFAMAKSENLLLGRYGSLRFDERVLIIFSKDVKEVPISFGCCKSFAKHCHLWSDASRVIGSCIRFIVPNWRNKRKD